MDKKEDLLGQLTYPTDKVVLSGIWGMSLRMVEVINFTPAGYIRYKDQWGRTSLHKSNFVKLTKEQLQNYKPEE